MYWPELDELDPATVEQAHTLICQMVEEKCPDLNAERGVLGNLVTELHAIMQGASLQAVEKLRHSLNVHDIVRDPDYALPAAIDKLASNFGVERTVATAARGYVTVILTRCTGVNFGPGTKLTAHGRVFYCDDTICIRPPGASKRNRHDVNVQDVGNGQYAIDIPVVAATIDPATMLKRYDPVELCHPPGGYVKAYAVDDFVGAGAPETNEQMVHKMRRGLAVPGWSNPMCVEALVVQSGLDIQDVHVCWEDGLKIYIRSPGYPKTIAEDPNIKALQEYLDDPDIKQPGLDVEVCAPTPCYVPVALTTDKPTDDNVVAARAYIDSLGIGEQPHKLKLLQALPAPDSIESIDLHGIRIAPTEVAVSAAVEQGATDVCLSRT